MGCFNEIYTIKSQHSISSVFIFKSYWKFSFQTFTLKKAIRVQIKRGDFVFQMEGWESLDYVRVFETDISFESTSINRIDTVNIGRIFYFIGRFKQLSKRHSYPEILLKINGR